jgi:hypothetical protein
LNSSSMIKYWVWLCKNTHHDPLLREAYEENLLIYGNNEPCWLRCIHILLKHINMDHMLTHPESKGSWWVFLHSQTQYFIILLEFNTQWNKWGIIKHTVQLIQLIKLQANFFSGRNASIFFLIQFRT